MVNELVEVVSGIIGRQLSSVARDDGLGTERVLDIKLGGHWGGHHVCMGATIGQTGAGKGGQGREEKEGEGNHGRERETQGGNGIQACTDIIYGARSEGGAMLSKTDKERCYT